MAIRVFSNRTSDMALYAHDANTGAGGTPNYPVRYTYTSPTAPVLWGIDVAMAQVGSAIWTAANVGAAAREIRAFLVTAGGGWSAGPLTANLTGAFPKIKKNASGDFTTAFLEGGIAYVGKFKPAVGEGFVTAVGGATVIGDILLDADSRLIVTLYNGGWRISVGTLNADGVAWTFSTPILMGIGAIEAAGLAMIQLADKSYLAFGVVTGTATIYRCRSLLSTGAGTWS